MAVSVGSLIGDTVEIPEFSLAGVDVNLENQGRKANFKIVLDNLGRFESAERPQADEDEVRKYVTRDIVIKDEKAKWKPLEG